MDKILKQWKLVADAKMKKLKGDIPDKLIELFYLIFQLIFEILKQKKPTEAEIDKIADTVADLWMEYLNIKFFPDMWERPVVKAIVRALIAAAVKYFTDKQVVAFTRRMPGFIK